MAFFLAGTADWHVVRVEDDTDLVHEPDLLLIVACQVVARGRCGRRAAGWFGADEAGRDAWEETCYILGGDRLGSGGHLAVGFWAADLGVVRRCRRSSSHCLFLLK